MYPFSHSVTPALRSHFDAQLSFCSDLSKALSRSFQRLYELNLQLGQTMLEEGSIATQQLLQSEGAGDALTASASRAQPAANKLRAYQQHVSRVVADAQLELARVSEQHSPITSRTARNLADQVAQVAAAETEKNAVKQREVMTNFRDPFQSGGVDAGNFSAGANGSLQSADLGGDVNGKAHAAFHGSEQRSGGNQQARNKEGAKPV